MQKRKIIKIDEEKCTGCGLCIPNCPEGALQIIDGKARVVSELFCDGLGACIGHCPEDAIATEEREAQAYDEKEVMERTIVKQGENVIKAHLEHLKEHNQREILRQAIDYLNEKKIEVPIKEVRAHEHVFSKEAASSGCPGARVVDFTGKREWSQEEPISKVSSQLEAWPIQMHLISPHAPYYQGADVLLAADCVAYALGGFHQGHLKGKSLAIACPKLDRGQDVYVEKIRALIDQARINTLTVMIMQVPCCMGLVDLARKAQEGSRRKVPLKSVVVSLQGEILQEEWV